MLEYRVISTVFLAFFKYINAFSPYRTGLKNGTFRSVVRCTLNILHMRSHPPTTQENAAEAWYIAKSHL